MRVAGFLSRQSRNTRRAPYLQRSPRFSCSRTQVENPGDLSLSCITHTELRTGNCTALKMPEIQTGLLLLTMAHKAPWHSLCILPSLHQPPPLPFCNVPHPSLLTDSRPSAPKPSWNGDVTGAVRLMQRNGGKKGKRLQ